MFTDFSGLLTPLADWSKKYHLLRCCETIKPLRIGIRGGLDCFLRLAAGTF